MTNVFKGWNKKSKAYTIEIIIWTYYEDTVELDCRITHNYVYPYHLTIVDHYNKYVFAYAILHKEKHKQLEMKRISFCNWSTFNASHR